MGDRANIRLQHGSDAPSIYLYTHWRGSDLPAIVAEGLTNARPRWNDVQYLNRIVFSTLTQGQPGTELTGYGLGTMLGDGEDRIVHVNTRKQCVRLNRGRWYTFVDFIAKRPAPAW